MPEVGKDFVLVTKIGETDVSFTHKKSKQQNVDKEEFLNFYQGVVWLSEPNERSGETNFTENKLTENKKKVTKNSIILSGIILLVLLIGANIPSENIFAFSTISFLKIVGLTITILLIIYEIDKNNAFVKNVCSLTSKTDCDAVLGSKASKILGVSWGEIGFFYFSATFIGLLLPSISFSTKVTFLALSNYLAVPYVFFSIYYQWRIVKQWCPLCISVQIILLCEFLWNIITVGRNINFNVFETSNLLSAFFCILLPVTAWYALKKSFVKANDHDLY